jgi:hypothetical protein
VQTKKEKNVKKTVQSQEELKANQIKRVRGILITNEQQSITTNEQKKRGPRGHEHKSNKKKAIETKKLEE